MTKPANERTKVVVRKLPPGLTEEGFKTAADKVAAGTYTWFSYHQGKVSTRKLLLSRAYLDFSEPRHVLAFKTAFDGHVFVTTKGNQYKCSVEYAPYQKVPQPAKKNLLEGTIEQDPHYQAFLKELQDGPALLPSAAAQREQQDKEKAASGLSGEGKGVVITPLMEYLRDRHMGGGGAGAAARGRAQRDRAQGAAKDALTPGDKKGGEGRQGSGKAGGEQRGGGGGGRDAAARAADVALQKQDTQRSGKDKPSTHHKPPNAAPGTDATASTSAPKGAAVGSGAVAAAKHGGRPTSAPVPAQTPPQKTLMVRPKDVPAVPSTSAAPAAAAGTAAAGDRKQLPATNGTLPQAQGRAAAQPASAGAPRGRPGSAAATAPAAAAPPTRAAPQQSRPAAAAHAAAATAAKAAVPTAKPGAPAAAAAAPAAGPADGGADGAAGGAAAADGAAAVPARRVRAGFQAYRPPVRPGADSG